MLKFNKNRKLSSLSISIFCLIVLLFSVHCSRKGGGTSNLILLAAGEKDKKNETDKSKKALLTAFEIEGKKTNITNQDIKVTLPFGPDITKLKATYKISEKASISPSPAQQTDYTKPVRFTVTAEDGTTKKTYTVTVTVEEPILSWTAGWRDDDNFTATIINRTITIDVDSADFITKVTLSDGVTIDPNPISSAIDWTKAVTFTASKGTKTETYNVKVTVDGKNILKVSDFALDMTAEWRKHGNQANYNYMDVSDVRRINGWFDTSFNGNITKWDVSKVNNMENMFTRNYRFNQDIGDWDVSNVTNMQFMFNNARAFNQNIGGWNVSNVGDMQSMFLFASAFNQNLTSWPVGQVIRCRDFSSGATAFQTANKPPSANFRCTPGY